MTTTMIYAHVLDKGGLGFRSPLDVDSDSAWDSAPFGLSIPQAYNRADMRIPRALRPPPPPTDRTVVNAMSRQTQTAVRSKNPG